jgi:hypothetical protein
MTEVLSLFTLVIFPWKCHALPIGDEIPNSGSTLKYILACVWVDQDGDGAGICFDDLNGDGVMFGAEEKNS